jgi:hypothetical protein
MCRLRDLYDAYSRLAVPCVTTFSKVERTRAVRRRGCRQGQPFDAPLDERRRIRQQESRRRISATAEALPDPAPRWRIAVRAPGKTIPIHRSTAGSHDVAAGDRVRFEACPWWPRRAESSRQASHRSARTGAPDVAGWSRHKSRKQTLPFTSGAGRSARLCEPRRQFPTGVTVDSGRRTESPPSRR